MKVDSLVDVSSSFDNIMLYDEHYMAFLLTTTKGSHAIGKLGGNDMENVYGNGIWIDGFDVKSYLRPSVSLLEFFLTDMKRLYLGTQDFLKI